MMVIDDDDGDDDINAAAAADDDDDDDDDYGDVNIPVNAQDLKHFFPDSDDSGPKVVIREALTTFSTLPPTTVTTAAPAAQAGGDSGSQSVNEDSGPKVIIRDAVTTFSTLPPTAVTTTTTKPSAQNGAVTTPTTKPAAQNGADSGAPSADDGSSAKPYFTCRPEFAARDGHTMCMVDSDRVVTSGVSDADKKIIVDFHNKVRREVQPAATDLTALVWDDKVAEIAQKLTMQCRMFHDKDRSVPCKYFLRYCLCYIIRLLMAYSGACLSTV
ncbi:venom allergen 5 [Elysia marginata]|uniref:Venom allergen 5 n=1 Tax=Elysia marginata TaxID=1093978 RepID=A0AAV4JVN0_9GAST|nr:venom allergen 5 [Elysia marginata]